MSGRTELVKEIRDKYTEKDRYTGGLWVVKYHKSFERIMIADQANIIETTRKNGVITFSAMYPENSDYARMRMSDQ